MRYMCTAIFLALTASLLSPDKCVNKNIMFHVYELFGSLILEITGYLEHAPGIDMHIELRNFVFEKKILRHIWND